VKQDKVIIFDTTLRDGEQAPGCSMTLNEKLRVATSLRELNVDVIEAGFPAASPGDFESVSAIAEDINGPSICGLARCNNRDIELAWSALKKAKKPRIHVFVATSEIHRRHKLKLAKDEIIKTAVDSIKFAKSLCNDIEFSPEDASRTELNYLSEVVDEAIKAGATTINIPDTVGYAVPGEFYNTFKYLKDNVKNIDKITLSSHCHDDLGMAVANSLAAVEAGARQVECTINGIGERAGNCSLEEIVMALKTRIKHFRVETNIKTQKLYHTSRIVSNVTGMHVPRNKAIIGENAFAHEAGIHQHGMLQNQATYEIMKPEDVGLSKSNLVLGKHSGRHAFKEKVEQLGFTISSEEELKDSFKKFKEIADKKKNMYDRDIESIVMNTDNSKSGPWSMEEIKVSSISSSHSSAIAIIKNEDGKLIEKSAKGEGPVAAIFSAIEKITQTELRLKNFEVRGITDGDDAQGEVTVSVEYNGQSYRGQAISTDILESAALAYLEVVNRVYRLKDNSNLKSAKKTNLITP
tara:strand:- start:164 stop:1729 length:1566 start_codon:yes stop_codon:yes gene_type:complete